LKATAWPLSLRRGFAWRKTIVEPVFGQIEQAQGFRQFLLRGVEKERSEWAKKQSVVLLTRPIMLILR
jgi:hypothetical protein